MPSCSSSSSWRGLPVAVGPLEGTGVSSSSLDTSSSAPPPYSSLTVGHPRPFPPLRPRGRRPLRVLYPPSLSRRPPPQREAPDPARRWLLFLSVLLFLQIYTEEACPSELQSNDPDTPQPQEGEGSLGTVRAWAGVAVEDQWSAQTVAGASGKQLECVVA